MATPTTKKKIICIDPGHGMSNVRAGVYDPGAVAAQFAPNHTEANIVLTWALELEKTLKEAGYEVILTRRDAKSPTPLSKRTALAKQHKADLLISIHTNSFNGRATGAETFYRHPSSAKISKTINDNYASAMTLQNRGSKHESATKRGRIHVLSYKDSILIELGFIDNSYDHKRMTSPSMIKIGCESIKSSLDQIYNF